MKADAELREVWSKTRLDACIMKYDKIQWSFTTPLTQHCGGVFERMVQAIKRAVYVTLKKGLSDEELITVATVAEGFLNNRPLTNQISSDPEHIDPITPNHFHAGFTTQNLAYVATTEENDHMKLHKKVQARLDECWKRFISEIGEIVPHYHHLNKWQREGQQLKEGDIVLNMQTKDRGRFPLARIVKVQPTARDNIVRRVTIQIQRKIIQAIGPQSATSRRHVVLTSTPTHGDQLHQLQLHTENSFSWLGRSTSFPSERCSLAGMVTLLHHNTHHDSCIFHFRLGHRPVKDSVHASQPTRLSFNRLQVGLSRTSREEGQLPTMNPHHDPEPRPPGEEWCELATAAKGREYLLPRCAYHDWRQEGKEIVHIIR